MPMGRRSTASTCNGPSCGPITTRPRPIQRQDWRKVTQYWIDHCFNMPEYYRIDNRPAVFIWSPQNVRNDLGREQRGGQALRHVATNGQSGGLSRHLLSGHEFP